MCSNIEIKKKCRWCGAEFLARKTTTEYCSHRCSGLAYKERKRQAKLDSYQREYEYQQSGQKEVAKQEFLTPTQAATLLGVCHVTIYNYINRGVIKVWKLKRKTLIRRVDVDAIFSTLEIQEPSATRQQPSITEFYTSKEVQEKYNVSNSGMYKIAEREGWTKTQSRGKTLWSRSHVDRYFASQQPKEEISEWYTVADIQAKYGMTLSAIYTLVSKEGIPKKKQGNYVQTQAFCLAATLKEERLRAGLTQQQLAERIGTKKTYISRLENGKADVQLSTLFRIFEGLGRRVSLTIL